MNKEYDTNNNLSNQLGNNMDLKKDEESLVEKQRKMELENKKKQKDDIFG